MYCSVLLVPSIFVFVLGQFVFSISIPMDDVNSPSLFFDSTPSSSVFSDDDEFSSTTTTTTTTAETLPNFCAAVADPDGLSYTQGDMNLFSRRSENGAACLPPVNIGAEALQLFERPLDLLENIVLPLKEQNSDDSSFGYPGIFLPGDRGNLNIEDTEKSGWQPYTGEVRYDIPKSNDCKRLTAQRGNFDFELCCDNVYAELPFNQILSNAYRQVDAATRRNSDFAVVWDCVRTFFFFFF